jgi:dihydroorotate dehydrogenase electron transfer subunit
MDTGDHSVHLRDIIHGLEPIRTDDNNIFRGYKIDVKLSIGTIEESIELTADTYRLSIAIPDQRERVSPGQFYMIKGWEGNHPLLRRPFSISDTDGDILSFVIKSTGVGTKKIVGLSRGIKLSILGPLGRGFVTPGEVDKHIFVAGGVGIAPFPLLKKELVAATRSPNIELLYGERDATKLIDTKVLGFDDIPVFLITEDGSSGQTGRVTDLLDNRLDEGNQSIAVYACGPWAMLKEVQSRVSDRSLSLQVSLENNMGCGVGSCMGCVIRVVKDGQQTYSRVCSTGPVFDGREVVF